MPEAESMVGKTLVEVINMIDLKKVLYRNFRSSLSRLVFVNEERSNHIVRNEIQTIISLLNNIDFINLNKEILLELLHFSGKESVELGIEAIDEVQLSLSGTFQDALHAQVLSIVSLLFAFILSHINRNGNMLILNQTSNDEKSIDLFTKIWMQLFRFSFNSSQIIAVQYQKQIKTNNSILINSDGYDAICYKGLFPFSFYLSPLIESMRKVASDLNARLI